MQGGNERGEIVYAGACTCTRHGVQTPDVALEMWEVRAHTWVAVMCEHVGVVHITLFNSTSCGILYPPPPPNHAELLDLRRKFEEDRKRIQDLRASRNFKPFS